MARIIAVMACSAEAGVSEMVDRANFKVYSKAMFQSQSYFSHIKHFHSN